MNLRGGSIIHDVLYDHMFVSMCTAVCVSTFRAVCSGPAGMALWLSINL